MKAATVPWAKREEPCSSDNDGQVMTAMTLWAKRNDALECDDTGEGEAVTTATPWAKRDSVPDCGANTDTEVSGTTTPWAKRMVEVIDDEDDDAACNKAESDVAVAMVPWAKRTAARVRRMVAGGDLEKRAAQQDGPMRPLDQEIWDVQGSWQQ